MDAEPRPRLVRVSRVLAFAGLLIPLAGLVGIVCAGVGKARGMPGAANAFVLAILCTAFSITLGAVLTILA